MEVVNGGGLHRVLFQLFGSQRGLDVAAAPDLRARLAGITGSTVEVDLSPLTFLDCRGLSGLLAAKRRVTRDGHSTRLVGAQGIVRRVFTLTGLDHELDD